MTIKKVLIIFLSKINVNSLPYSRDEFLAISRDAEEPPLAFSVQFGRQGNFSQVPQFLHHSLAAIGTVAAGEHLHTTDTWVLVMKVCQ